METVIIECSKSVQAALEPVLDDVLAAGNAHREGVRFAEVTLEEGTLLQATIILASEMANE